MNKKYLILIGVFLIVFVLIYSLKNPKPDILLEFTVLILFTVFSYFITKNTMPKQKTLILIIVILAIIYLSFGQVLLAPFATSIYVPGGDGYARIEPDCSFYACDLKDNCVSCDDNRISSRLYCQVPKECVKGHLVLMALIGGFFGLLLNSLKRSEVKV